MSDTDLGGCGGRILCAGKWWTIGVLNGHHVHYLTGRVVRNIGT